MGLTDLRVTLSVPGTGAERLVVFEQVVSLATLPRGVDLPPEALDNLLKNAFLKAFPSIRARDHAALQRRLEELHPS